MACLLGSAFSAEDAMESLDVCLALQAKREQAIRHHQALVMWSMAENRHSQRRAMARGPRPVGPSPLGLHQYTESPQLAKKEAPLDSTNHKTTSSISSTLAPLNVSPPFNRLKEEALPLVLPRHGLKSGSSLTTAPERSGLAPVRPQKSAGWRQTSALRTPPSSPLPSLRCMRPPSTRTRRASREYGPTEGCGASLRAARVRRQSRERVIDFTCFLVAQSCESMTRPR